VTEFSRKPTGKVAENRVDDEEYNISEGSAGFMSWLGVMLLIPGIVLLAWEAKRSVPWGVFFIVLGLYIAWTGFGSFKLFK
jgi:hypothetical protein